jgi:hypothetical protein
MRRIIKNPDSEIVLKNIRYKIGDNKKLSKLLLKEQKNFCAYTEEYIGINDASDIEHFNPNLKFTDDDCYENWFMVKHKPNSIKSTKWLQPILHPTDENFEQKLIYSDGCFLCHPDDIATQNIIDLLDLNNLIFVRFRQKFIKRRKERIHERGVSIQDYFKEKIENEIESIKFLRAIQEEFKIDIWKMIPY